MTDRRAYNFTYKQLLTGPSNKSSGKLLIANFQRNYNWGGKNVKKLLDSIWQNERGYYIGNLVIQAGRDGAGDYDRIVDGQQRTITLSLIVNEIKKLVTDTNDIKKCNEILFYSGQTPRIKFSRKNLDTSYKKILASTKQDEVDKSQATLYENQKVIKGYLKKNKAYSEILDKIFYLEFVVIKCKTTSGVYQLFEALNSHGKKLTATELIKNGLLSETNESPSNEKRINATWEKMEQLFETSEVNNIWFGKFMRHNWYSIKGKVSENNLYDSLREYSKKTDATSFTKTLLESAEIYTKLRTANISKKDFSNSMNHAAWQELESLIRTTRELELDQVYAVLLALVKYGKKNPQYFNGDRLTTDVFKIWSFVVLIKFSKVSPSKYESIFATFCFELLNKPAVAVTKRNFYSKLKKIVPSKTDFIHTLNKSIICTGKTEDVINFSNNREFIRLLLMVYLTDGQEISGKYTIEHIIPKGNLSKWKTISKEAIGEVEQVSRYRLGNLTLVEKDEVQNSKFDIKYNKLYSRSRFKKNNELNIYSSLFNSKTPQKAISKREKKVAGDIYNALLKNLC